MATVTEVQEYLPSGVRLQDINQWEDNYGATKFADFDAFIQNLEGWTFGGFGSLNQPIWIYYDKDNESEWDCGPVIQVGVFMPRHGQCWIKMAPCTPEQAHRVCDLLGRFWAGRMDVGFERYN